MKVFLVSIVVIVTFSQQLHSQSKTVQLFNGKDLSGWYMDVPVMDKVPDTTQPFLVRNGLLVTLGEPRGHLLTDEIYENYRLDIEYRFPGETGNGGVLIHASEHRALYDMFPKSVEVQMMHENAGDFWCIVEDITVPDMVERRGPEVSWGIRESENRRILNLTDDSEKPPGEWNRMIVEVISDEIRVWVNGDLVNHGYDATASRGKIAIQAEGAEMEFRKIELENYDFSNRE